MIVNCCQFSFSFFGCVVDSSTTSSVGNVATDNSAGANGMLTYRRQGGDLHAHDQGGGLRISGDCAGGHVCGGGGRLLLQRRDRFPSEVRTLGLRGFSMGETPYSTRDPLHKCPDCQTGSLVSSTQPLSKVIKYLQPRRREYAPSLALRQKPRKGMQLSGVLKSDSIIHMKLRPMAGVMQDCRCQPAGDSGRDTEGRQSSAAVRAGCSQIRPPHDRDSGQPGSPPSESDLMLCSFLSYLGLESIF